MNKSDPQVAKPVRFNALAPPPRLVKLTVEITTQCNLKCRGCPRTIGVNTGTWRNSNMTADAFSKIVENLPPVGMATLHGIGEPLMNEDLIDIVRIARSSGKFGVLKVTTNGLTRSPEVYRELIAAGLNMFWVSIDSLDQATAEIVRFGTKVDKLRDRMAWFLKEALPVEVSMVVSAYNYRSLEETLRVLYELGNPSIHMQEFQDYGDTGGLMTAEQRREFLETMRRISAEMPDLRVRLPNFTQPTGQLCLAPWQRPGITVDGYLTPCCTTFDASLFAFQDLKRISLAEAWRQEPVQQWIKNYTKTRPPMCVGCALDPRGWGNTDNTLSHRGGDQSAHHRRVEQKAF